MRIENHKFKKKKKRALLLVNDGGFSEATLCRLTIDVNIVVAPNLLRTILFQISLARATTSTTSNEATNSDYIPYGELAHI